MRRSAEALWRDPLARKSNGQSTAEASADAEISVTEVKEEMSAQKRHEGRDEPILEPDIPIIDSQMHLFVRPGLRYLLDDYLDDARAGHRVIASVFVEANSFKRIDGPEVLRPLGEIEFANGIGAMGASGAYGDVRPCAAIVGYADLRFGDRVAALLDRALATGPDRLRGIRQVTMEHPSDAPFRWNANGRPEGGILTHPRFRDGFRELTKRGLTFDAAVFQHQLPEISDLADAFPSSTIIVNHMAPAPAVDMSREERKELFVEWRNHLVEAARRPNILCKIGGLGMPMWGFNFQDRPDPVGYIELAKVWRPFVEEAVKAFGVQRCMMESNFPPDGHSCGFVPLWNALKHTVSDFSAEEKGALFSGTAAEVYRIELPSPLNIPKSEQVRKG